MKFRCLNPQCGQLSRVGTIDLFEGQHITDCEHCREAHALQQLATEDEDAPIQFVVAGLIND